MNITIAEELLLLAYSEEEGRPLVGSTELNAAVGGAVLAELAVIGRVDLAGDRVVALDRSPTGDDELDAALTRIADESKPRKPDWWVHRLQSEKLRTRLLTRLAERGVLDAERHRVLGVFPTTRYPERDPGLEREIRQRVGSALAGTDPDARVAVLVALMRAAKLDRKAFPGADRRRIKEISEGEWAGTAVAKTIASVNAAVMAAVTAATVAGAASGGSGT